MAPCCNASHAIGLGEEAKARVEHVEDEPCSSGHVLSNRPETTDQILGLVQMQEGVGRNEHEIECAAKIQGHHVPLYPIHRHTAFTRLPLSLIQHITTLGHASKVDTTVGRTRR